MIDTFMALWNQDRRKRARQILLTFSLLCIGISLLLVLINKELQHQKRRTSLGQQTPTAPAFGSTVVPDRTPTVSVVVGSQPTSIATPNQRTPGATPTQLPPSATTQPCITPPSSTTNIHTHNPLQQISSPIATRPLQHFDGGRPIKTATPTPPPPTPTRSITPTPGPQPGWTPNCTTSNSVSVFAGRDTLTLLQQNIWFILISSMLGTAMFYAILFAIKRRGE